MNKSSINTFESTVHRPKTARAGRWPHCLRLVAISLVALAPGFGGLAAESIALPNASFESPATTFANPQVDFWQKTGKPAWYDESTGYSWNQLTGVFKNTAPGSPDYIANVDGDQALFLFALPQVGIFQDLGTDATNPAPALNTRFEVGKACQLTVGVIGGGGNMKEGVSLQVSLYYVDAASNRVTVAATNIVFTRADFPNTTNLLDCQVRVPVVRPGDPWAGRPLGIQMLSTVGFDLMGGYWDLDHVRLTMRQVPLLASPRFSLGQLAFTLQSEPDLQFEILTTTNLALPVSAWTNLGTVTNSTGTSVFVGSPDGASQRFYQARQTP